MSKRKLYSLVDVRPVPYEEAWQLEERSSEDGHLERIIGVIYHKDVGDKIVRALNLPREDKD